MTCEPNNKPLKLHLVHHNLKRIWKYHQFNLSASSILATYDITIAVSHDNGSLEQILGIKACMLDFNIRPNKTMDRGGRDIDKSLLMT